MTTRKWKYSHDHGGADYDKYDDDNNDDDEHDEEEDVDNEL